MLKVEFEDQVHPILVCLVLFGRAHNQILPGLPQKELIVVRFLLQHEVAVDDLDDLGQVVLAEHGIQVALHNVARENQEEDVEVRGLVVSKLDQTIVDQEGVVFGELEAPVSTST
jgi:hypothetical protein